MPSLYYTPPGDLLFEEVKTKAIELWSRYNDPIYTEEKVRRIKDIENVSDNFMYIIAMFDILNQRKLADVLSPEAKQAVNERMFAGGQPDWANPFLT